MATDHINNRRRGLTTPATKCNVEIKEMETDRRLHYVYYNGCSQGIVCTGSEEQCRDHIINNKLQDTAIVITEEQCNKLRNMSKSQITSYFELLSQKALTRSIDEDSKDELSSSYESDYGDRD